MKWMYNTLTGGKTEVLSSDGFSPFEKEVCFGGTDIVENKVYT